MVFKTANSFESKKFSIDGIDLSYVALPASDVLPSKGKLYGSPKFVYVRGLKYKEQLELTMITDNTSTAQSQDLLFRVLPQCIIIPDVDFSDFLIEDLSVLAMWVTLITNKQQEYKISYKCPQCNENLTHTIKIARGDLFYEDLKSLDISTFDSSLGKLVLAPILVSESREFVESISEEEALFYYGSQYIKKLNGEDLSIQKRIEVFGMLDVTEANDITNITRNYVSGVRPIDVKCDKCDYAFKVEPDISLIKAIP